MTIKDRHQIPMLADNEVGPVNTIVINLAGHSFKISQPEFPDRLLDTSKVLSAFAADEYMPYWATLWPVASFLSENVLRQTWTPGLRALELGCGLGLPGLAAMAKGMSVLFTDYDSTALKFVETNCRLNGFLNFKTEVLDLRAQLPETFDVILASDLIYERRNVEPLVSVLTKNLSPTGTALVADQNRPYQENFLACLTEAGFKWTVESKDMLNQEQQWTVGSIFTINRM